MSDRPNNGHLDDTAIWRISSTAYRVREAFEAAAIVARDECLWLAQQCRAMHDDNEKLRIRNEKLEADAVPKVKSPTFEEAWAKKVAEGYQYSEDALEHVRFGWEMAMGTRSQVTPKPIVPAERVSTSIAEEYRAACAVARHLAADQIWYSVKHYNGRPDVNS